MAKLVVLYPNAETHFDSDYYLDKHDKMAGDAWDKAGLTDRSYVFGEAAPGGGPAPFHCIATLTFTDRAALEAAAASPDAAAILGDIPNFTDSTPVTMIGAAAPATPSPCAPDRPRSASAP